MLDQDNMMMFQREFEKKLRHELASIQASVDFVSFALRRRSEKSDVQMGALLHSANESLNTVIHQLDARDQPMKSVDAAQLEENR